MAIRVICQTCQKALQVKEELAGKRVRCPSCKQSLTVPASPETGDQEDHDEEGESLMERIPWPWVAGAATVLFLICLPFTLHSLFSSGSSKDSTAASERQALETIDELKKDRARFEGQVRQLSEEVSKLKKLLTTAEEQAKTARSEADDLKKLLAPNAAKTPAGKDKAPPETGGAKKENGNTRELIIGRWRDIKNAKSLGDGKNWGDMEFSKDGKLVITVRDTKTLKPSTLAGKYRVLDDGQAEITIDGSKTGSDFLDSPPWTSIELGAAILNRTQHTMKVKIAVGKTKLTLAGFDYERIAAAPTPKDDEPTPKSEVDPKAGVKVTKVIRARKAITGDNKTLSPNFPQKDVVVLLKIENVPAMVAKGSALFLNSYVTVKGEKRTFNTMTVPAAAGPIWAGAVIPTDARTLTLQLGGNLPAVSVDLPQTLVDEAKVSD